VSGVAPWGWTLNNLLAFDESGSIVETSYTGYKEEFPQGAEVTARAVSCSPLRNFAFSTQNAEEVIISVTYEKSGETFQANHTTPVTHWSGEPRDGGDEFTEEDSEDPTHWSYTFVEDPEKLNTTHASSWCNIKSNW
jgi:hypothetical protein